MSEGTSENCWSLVKVTSEAGSKSNLANPAHDRLQAMNPFKPVILSGEQPDPEKKDSDPLSDFLWLLK